MKKPKRLETPQHDAAIAVARTLIRVWPETFADWKPENLASWFRAAIAAALLKHRKRGAK